MGVSREPITIDPTDTTKPRLPDNYVMVKPCEIPKSTVFMPSSGDKVIQSYDRVEGAKLSDQVWIKQVKDVMSKELLEKVIL